MRLWQGLAAAFALAAVLATLPLLQRTTPASRADTATVRFVVDAMPGTAFAHPGEGQDLSAASMSPDGSKIVYSARSESVVRLWLRALDDVVATPLTGTEGVSAPPFWSPDNDAVAFVAGGRLRRIATSGGLIQTVSPVVNFYGGTWNRAGVMVVSDNGRLHRVSAAGGSLEPLTLTGTSDDTFHLSPVFLPDGEHFLFVAWTVGNGIGEGSIMSASLSTGETSTVLPKAESEAMYSSGHLTFLRDGVLMAQPFDATTRRTTGDAFPVVTPVRAGWSVSDNGMLVYRASQPAGRIQLTWLDRQGQTIGTVGEPHRYGGVDVSPDGSRVAVHRHTDEGGDIWIHEPRGTVTRLTFDPAKHHASPVWSPDGRRLVFSSFRDGRWGVYVKASDGSGADERLVQSKGTVAAMSWSPDGEWIAYNETPTLRRGSDSQDDGQGHWLLPLAGPRAPVPLVVSPFPEWNAQVSPDGRWFAHWVNHSGRFEIYVKPFPSGDGSWQVSTQGGMWPRWRRDGKELFYWEGQRLMAVPIDITAGTFTAGAPQFLFEANVTSQLHETHTHPWAAAPDGQRFLVPLPASAETEADVPLTVVINWLSGAGK